MRSGRPFPVKTGRFNNLFWFVVFIILTGGLSYVLARAKAANSPVLSLVPSPNKNTHANRVAEMQSQRQLDIAHPVCDITAAPASLEVNLANRIYVEFWLSAKLGVEETQNLKQVVRKSEADIAEMEADLANGKPVMIGKLHIKKFDRNNGQVYAWGYHASDLTDAQQLVHAYIYDNLRHINTVKTMYKKHASENGEDLHELSFIERDAEIHGSPKHAEFFCSPLTMYHAEFRKAHAIENEAVKETQKFSLSSS